MTYVEALRTLISQDDNELVQVLYIRLESGKVLTFIGAPVSEEDADQIEDVVLGEQIPPFLIGAAASLSPGTTAQ